MEIITASFSTSPLRPSAGSYGEDLYSDESDPDHEQDAHRRDALSGLKQRIPQQVMLSKAALHLRRAIVRERAV